MTNLILVCPFDVKLLAGLRRWKVVVHTNEGKAICQIHREVSKANDLHAILFRTEKSLSTLAFKEEWVNLPLAIYAEEFGEYKDLLPQMERIRKANVRIFLSSQHEFNYTGIRILSSLNINCGLYFNGAMPDWERMNDLMHFAIYSRTRHAPVEPFDWLVSHYQPAGYTDYNAVYFDDPSRYIHVNEKEQIALTASDLSSDNFIGEGIDLIEKIDANTQYSDFLNRRYSTIQRLDECAFCPAFRICLAKYSHLRNKKKTCKPFFSDFMDAADYYYSKINSGGNRIWQL
jgi:hypothetical protein